MSPEQAKQQVFQYWDYLHTLAERRFAGDAALKEQAVNYSLDKLAADDWRRVRAYQGNGFSAFITVVVNRLLSDFAREIGDSPTLPAWVKKQGPLWQRAWTWLCVKRREREEALQALRREAEAYQEAHLREIIAAVQRHCPDKVHMQPLTEETVAELADDRETADNLQVQGFWLLHLLQQLAPGAEPVEKRLSHLLECLRQGMVLNDEEYLLLKLVYDEGLKVSEAGRRLGLRTDQVAGRRRRLLERLRSALENCGLAKDFWFEEE